MGANSKHYGDVSKWISKVIDSCITVEQIHSAQKLIESFDNYFYKLIDRSLRDNLKRNLQIQLDCKFETIINNLI